MAQYEKYYAQTLQEIRNVIGVKAGIHKELRIIRWIARDNDGTLMTYSDKPEVFTNHAGDMFWTGGNPVLIDKKLFPEITWESGPKELKITISL